MADAQRFGGWKELWQGRAFRFVQEVSQGEYNTDMSLSHDDVLHVARLARVAVSPDEVDRLRDQLTDILAQFRSLQELDTADVPPTAQVHATPNTLRDDEPQASAGPENVLKNAPNREGDYFRVRAVLDE